MARSHRMTPARRAALRKAQLASAKKRRKSGAVSQAKRSISQRRQYNAANRALTKKKSHRIRKIAVVGVATATVLGGVAASSQRSHASVKASARRDPIRVHSERVFGQPTRALGTGPKGKAALRSRRYRAREGLRRDGLYRSNGLRYG